MARTRKPDRDELLMLMEEQLRQVVANPKLTAAERLKVIDVGARLLHIRHRIEDKGERDGGFFSDTPRR